MLSAEAHGHPSSRIAEKEDDVGWRVPEHRKWCVPCCSGVFTSRPVAPPGRAVGCGALTLACLRAAPTAVLVTCWHLLTYGRGAAPRTTAKPSTGCRRRRCRWMWKVAVPGRVRCCCSGAVLGSIVLPRHKQSVAVLPVRVVLCGQREFPHPATTASGSLWQKISLCWLRRGLRR